MTGVLPRMPASNIAGEVAQDKCALRRHTKHPRAPPPTPPPPPPPPPRATNQGRAARRAAARSAALAPARRPASKLKGVYYYAI